ncbi:Zn-ribbon domain-containing OB-fold protein [Pollutimonas harenae]|uniref:Zn-ribbon domain-containing OB-fold protein n=1 Tax=Pollutimonas harenae TaxID=657015 RepID=A0A853H0F8_9BURK|nr:Zn-ribbon domain-containing OB-fold protein [Pollutimonas harenae]NYT86466.1 Zn-ribbon domain-containing OB-fold protein [Pollutimonas harenae]TEA69787.1 Zn-ribbon domain-containing OB-fold protein [Pollutimonas harenae]
MLSSQTSLAADATSTGADLYYRNQLDQGTFLIQRCASCERSIFYPRMICPHCGSDQLKWFAPTGRGTVYSTTVVRRKPEQGGDYNVALIDLEEGVRMMSRVEGVAPTDVTIGMPVQAQVADSDEGKLVVFNPTKA